MSNSIIEVENLSKQYRLGEVSTGSLSHDINRLWHRMRGKEDPYLSVTHVNDRTQASSLESQVSDYVWALEDINFEVKRGEVLGIIGCNGAGKSTLLKILSRVTAPTAGEIRVEGRIASLLEVGTGFHQDLTGRENIFLNGAILGMTKSEIRGKLDEIVDFSGCARYLDTPVKRYSSGMVVRLGFAVAAHLEPEILIIDEVLAVGDFEFQEKCLGKMSEVASQGRTVLFVSHNLASVQTLCQTAIWLDGGGVAMEKAEVSKVVSAYESSGHSDSGAMDIQLRQHKTVSPFQIQRIEMRGLNGRLTSAFKYGEPIRVRLLISCSRAMDRVCPGIGISSNGLRVTTLLSKEQRFDASEDLIAVECMVEGGALLPGVFHIEVGSSRSPGNIGLDYVPNAITFSISDAGIDPTWTFDRHMTGVVRMSGEWCRFDELGEGMVK